MHEPEPTYQDAIERLNAKSLQNCLEVCTLFSCIDFVGRGASPVFSLLNNENVRLLGEAVIKSKAAWYKERLIEPRDLPTLLNGANSALEDPRLSEQVISGGERAQMLFQLTRFISRMSYMQIRPQQNAAIATGQFFAIAEMLPAEHWQEFPENLRAAAAQFPAIIAATLGASLRDLLDTHHTVMEYLARLGRISLERVGVRPRTVVEQANLLRQMIEESSPQLDLFRIVPQRLEQAFGRALSSELEGYAAVFSRSIREHRRVLEERPYHVGPEGLRLSSLDRFPLVTGESKGVWYVPNMRALGRAAPDVLHFALNEGCRESYERLRGPSLELYLRRMLNARAPNLVVIPEGRWRTAKGEVAGPDLLVIDHREPPCVLAIEVKFRKMLPSTRFELLTEDLSENYGDLWEAVRKLPEKLTHVFSISGDYAAYASDLSRAQKYRRWCVGVAGEAPFGFGELSGQQSEFAPEFPLKGFAEPWTVMSVETFERLVEVVVQYDRPLTDVVADYCKDCQNLELSESRAEMFRSISVDEQQSYAAKCLARARIG